MNSRARRSDRARKAVKSVGAARQTVSERKPVQPPLVEPFHIAVDLQLKSGHPTYEAAERAALTIKRQYPQLHVTVYDSITKRHINIERSNAGSHGQ